MMLKMNRKGFTLVEIMITVVIIGLLAAIAIPNFVRTRQTALKNACDANLKQIQGAVQVWAIDTNADETTAPTEAALIPAYLKSMPKCGTTPYELPAPGADPVCPNPGHTLTPAEAVPRDV